MEGMEQDTEDMGQDMEEDICKRINQLESQKIKEQF